MATLVLVRHGPSAHVHRAGAVDRAGVERWRSSYDAAGIIASAVPPAAAMRLAEQAERLLCSDLRRARESAARLAPTRTPVISPLLRETHLAIPPWPTRLPLGAWGAMLYAQWQYRRLNGTEIEAAERERVAGALAFLVGHVSEGRTTVAVTHGVFRALLASALVETGWVAVQRVGGYDHWSRWSFQRAD